MVKRSIEQEIRNKNFGNRIQVDRIRVEHFPKVGKVFDRIIGSSDPELFVDQVGNLSAAKETVRSSFWAFCSSRLILFSKWELWMILFSAGAILASSTSKFGIEIPRVDNEDLNSSTESTNSTSLIHCIASAGKCEQVHSSILNLIFQQAKVVGVGNLSKWRSEICSRCWSAP